MLADISGYTGFVFGDPTEIEHSGGILTELIETITASFEGRLTLEPLEGDAVFAVTTNGRDLLGWLQECFIAFHRRVRDITAVTGCPCRACVNVGTLGLKFVAHSGEYVRQRVGTRDQLFGPPVIAVHRMLKNTVGLREYILATAPLIAQWPEDKEPFVPAPQEYPDVGKLEAAFLDLAPLRQRAWAYERTVVEPDEARLRVSTVLPATRSRVWRLLTDAHDRARWMHAEKVDVKGGARSTLLGAQYHCHHGADKPTVFRVLAYREPAELTEFCSLPPFGDVYGTYRCLEQGDGQTCLDLSYYWNPLPDDQDAQLHQLLQQVGAQSVEAMQSVLAEAGQADGT